MIRNRYLHAIIGFSLIIIILFSENRVILNMFVPPINKNIQIPATNPVFHASYDNYTVINNINQTDYFFNAKGACYVLAEVNGTDFTNFTIDNETYEVSYGFNVFSKDFGESFTSHNLTFRQKDVDNNNFKWVAIEPLFIEEDETIVNLTNSYNITFYAAGSVAILIQPDFFYNWLYLEVDGHIINNIYNTTTHPEINSAFYSYYVEKGAYLVFTFHMDPKEHICCILGNGSLRYKIITNYDWDGDLLSDLEEVQKELILHELDPSKSNVWGFYEKSSEGSYSENLTGEGSGFFRFFIPESYQGLSYLYINAKSGTLFNITVDDDDLTLKNITLSESCPSTPYGYLEPGYHTISYQYLFNEVTYPSFKLDGKPIIVIERSELKDADGDGLKDIQEFKNNLDFENPDTDQDGIPDNLDESPTSSLILDRKKAYQFILPCDPDKNTKVHIRVQRPDPDYTSLRTRIFLDNHSHGLGINVSIHHVLQVYGVSYTGNSSGWKKNSYSLVNNYDYKEDPVPDFENSLIYNWTSASESYWSTYSFIYAKITEKAFEFQLSYPKGHPAKNDSVLDIRFQIRYLAFRNESNKVELLRDYYFDNDIVIQSMIVEEVGDVNYILGAPDSMIENQILWTLTKNPLLGNPEDYDVQEDIIGMGTMDYLQIANQTYIDRNSTTLNANETEVLYVAGLQKSYDVLEKLDLQFLTIPEFNINKSSEYLSYFSFFIVNDRFDYGKNATALKDVFGDSETCYVISWNNYSFGQSYKYNQTCEIQEFPIFMDLTHFSGADVLQITQAAGANIPYLEIPSTLGPDLHEKIMLINQTYIEPRESYQAVPPIFFDQDKHILKELVDNRQWKHEASKYVFFDDYQPFSSSINQAYSNFKEITDNLQLAIEQLSTKKIYFYELLLGFEKDLDRINIINIISKSVNLIKAVSPLIKELTKNKIKFKSEIKIIYDNYVNTGLDPIKVATYKIVGKYTYKSVTAIFNLVKFCQGIMTVYDQLSGDYEDTFQFRLNFTKSIGSIIVSGLSFVNGIIQVVLTSRMFLTTLKVVSKFLSVAIFVVVKVIEFIDYMDRLTKAFEEGGEQGLKDEFWLIMRDITFPFIPLWEDIVSLIAEFNPEVAASLDWTNGLERRGEVPEDPEDTVENRTVEILWEDADGNPLSSFYFPIRDSWMGWLTIGDWMEYQLWFYNNLTSPVWIENWIGIPLANGTVVEESYSYTPWIVPSTNASLVQARSLRMINLKESSPNLTVSWRMRMWLDPMNGSDPFIIYNETMKLALNKTVSPEEMRDFYALTDEIPLFGESVNRTEVLIENHSLIEIDPIIGWTSVNLSLHVIGYNDTTISCNITLNNTNFSVDTSFFFQNLSENIQFNITSLSPYYLGGIYYFNLSIRLNDTGELVLSEKVPFRLSFHRNLSMNQANIIFKEESTRLFNKNNISSSIFTSSLNLQVGNIIFVKYRTNATKEINLKLLNNNNSVKTFLIRSRGLQNLTTQFIELFVDNNYTFNEFQFNGGLVNSEYFILESITIINASIQPLANAFFNPVNFTNNGNIPEFIKFTFSGIPFNFVDTTPYSDEFDGESQYIYLLPNNSRVCLYNITKPIISISNLYFRSITWINPIRDIIYNRYIDYFAIDGIYIDTPQNRTHYFYTMNKNQTFLLNIISEEDLVWTAYSLDNQPFVYFNQCADIPLPSDGLHTIQVFGNNSINESFKSEIKYFTFKSIMINITNPERKLYDYHVEGYIFNATYGFETDRNRSKPAGWTANDDAYIINERNGHIKVVELCDGGAILNTFDFPRTYGTIEFWLYFEKVDGFQNIPISVSCYDSIYDQKQFLIEVEDNQWFYYPNSTSLPLSIPNVAAPQNNTWHHIKIDFRCYNSPPYLGISENRFIVTIDGISSGELEHWYINLIDYSSIRFYTGTYSDYKTYLDAVGFSWDPDYNIGENYDNYSIYALPLNYTTPVSLQNLSFSLDGQDLIPITFPDLLPVHTIGRHTVQLYGWDNYIDIYGSQIRDFAVFVIDLPTPSGDNISLFDIYTRIRLNFTNVFNNGTTLISIVDNPTPFPEILNLNGDDYYTNLITPYYNISTSAVFYEPVIVMIPYNDAFVQTIESNLRLYQYDGLWYDITGTIDSTNNIITTINLFSFSIFVIIEVLDDVSPDIFFYVDGTPLYQWAQSTNNVSINITAMDGFSDIDVIDYRLNGGDWIPYTNPFNLNEGYWEIFARANDSVGNMKYSPLIWVRVDYTAPVTDILIDGASGITYVPWGAYFNFIVDDLSSTTTYYRINNGTFKIWNGKPFQFPEEGTIRIDYYSIDELGNIESLKSVIVYKETAGQAFLKQFIPILLIIVGAVVGILITRIILKKRQKTSSLKKEGPKGKQPKS
ncbi:MAG: hypothetical protein ACTSPQ_13415 [Candidatus Helarchaeota archaeon]